MLARVLSSIFVEQLKNAIAGGDPERFRECAAAIEDAQLGKESFNDEGLNAILDALRDAQFLAIAGSWRLLLAIDRDSSKLSADQRKRVLGALSHAYPRFVDVNACFQITELIGCRFADADGLETLLTFERIADNLRRSYVAHGLGDIVRHADDSHVRSAALDRLIAMHNDPEERVRYEVALALRGLAAQGHDHEAISATLDRLRDDPASDVCGGVVRFRSFDVSPTMLAPVRAPDESLKVVLNDAR